MSKLSRTLAPHHIDTTLRSYCILFSLYSPGHTFTNSLFGASLTGAAGLGAPSPRMEEETMAEVLEEELQGLYTWVRRTGRP